ncbi:Glycosyl hydrolase 5 family protein [Linum perenne]
MATNQQLISTTRQLFAAILLVSFFFLTRCSGGGAHAHHLFRSWDTTKFEPLPSSKREYLAMSQSYRIRGSCGPNSLCNYVPRFRPVDGTELETGRAQGHDDKLEYSSDLKFSGFYESSFVLAAAAMSSLRKIKPLFIIFIIFVMISTVPTSRSLPLSTNNRWIIDDSTGQRVKLACVNWAGALETMLPEGLDRQPLRSIVASIRRLGFNCVRLTYSTYMVTRMGPHIRVNDTFDQLGLGQAKAGIVKHNPTIVRMSHLEAFDAVVDELGRQGVMVDVDNHVSKPMWCCAWDDGNGFFGDKYFDPEEWLLGLTTLARRFLNKPQVVGMGLRNELRGARQNEKMWRKYVTLAGTFIHSINPNVLIIAGGMNFSTTLSFLKDKPLTTNFGNKLVYEAHWYAFAAEPETIWQEKPLNKLCRAKINSYVNNIAFSTEVPLFFGEVGIPGTNGMRSSDYFLSCLLSWAAEHDFDWGWWALQGDYYFRENETFVDEYYGVLSHFWDRTRNPFLINRLRLMQFKNQDPKSRVEKAYLLFHPQTGDCMSNNKSTMEVYMGNCDRQSSRWTYNGDDSPILLINSNYCLRAAGEGVRVQLTTECNTLQSKWRMLSASKLHLAAKDVNSTSGEYLCMKRDSVFAADVFTTKCICLSGDEPGCLDGGLLNPTSQWFKFVESNVVY